MLERPLYARTSPSEAERVGVGMISNENARVSTLLVGSREWTSHKSEKRKIIFFSFKQALCLCFERTFAVTSSRCEVFFI